MVTRATPHSTDTPVERVADDAGCAWHEFGGGGANATNAAPPLVGLGSARPGGRPTDGFRGGSAGSSGRGLPGAPPIPPFESTARQTESHR
jgi:hypothetical protein